MTTSVLEFEYKEPDRPFSQKELLYIRNKNFRSLRVGTTRAHHKRCDHYYNVKENGRKAKDMKEQETADIGNCSVCWKFNRTPRHLKARARDLISVYTAKFFTDPEIFTYDNIDIETSFYRWLYEEFN